MPTLRRLLCDCRLQVVLTGPDGQPVALSETRRTASPRMIRALFQRDGGCVWPGCGRTRWVHAHHRHHARHHGPTSADNLDLLCRTHHRLVHEGGWSYERRADGSVRCCNPEGIEWCAETGSLRAEIRERFPILGNSPRGPDPPKAA
jgi:hypothetical protein